MASFQSPSVAQSHPLLIAAIERFWELLTGGGGDEVISFGEYRDLHMRVSRALQADFAAAEGEAVRSPRGAQPRRR
jgi:hypothetical protein